MEERQGGHVGGHARDIERIAEWLELSCLTE